jgi:hypothetical protein
MTKTVTLCLALAVCGWERGGGEDSDPARVEEQALRHAAILDGPLRFRT